MTQHIGAAVFGASLLAAIYYACKHGLRTLLAEDEETRRDLARAGHPCQQLTRYQR